MARTFYIIDGHAQIFRAYFAPFRDLTSPTGEPTKATFVFTQMLINLVQLRKPDYLAIAIDTGTSVGFRREIYPEYKAHRPAPPPDFWPQEQRILQIIRDAGVPIFAKPGFEADDLIATLTHVLRGRDFDVVLVSKDKDLRQLLADHVRMYDVQADTFTTAESMAQELGYTPAQAIEVQTLMGDATDNVPGIPGVGDKTAVKLIQKYGSADAVLQHLDDLTPKLRENFQKHAAMLPMSRQLVTLKTDVEFGFNLEQCAFRGLNVGGLRKHLTELGFTTLLSRVEKQADVAPPASTSTKPVEMGLFGPMTEARASDQPAAITSEGLDYRLVNTEEKFAEFLGELKQQKCFAFDTETDDLGAMRSNVIGLSFSWREGTGYYIALRGPEGSTTLDPARTLHTLQPILSDPAIGKVGHNIKYDMLVMRVAGGAMDCGRDRSPSGPPHAENRGFGETALPSAGGIELCGVVMDTMVAAFLVDAGRNQYGMDGLARDLLGFRKIATEELIGKGKHQISMVRVPLEKTARYASEDADVTWRLAQLLRGKLKELPAVEKLHDELEVPLVDVLAEMEFNGVAIDPAMLREQSCVLAERAEKLRGQIMEAAGCEFNPDSPKQLADVLFTKLGLRSLRENKTGPSTDAEVLEKLSLEHKVPRLILEYRGLVKLINTYLDKLAGDINARTGRIHGSFNQTGAATGRLSMSDPNLQNIPIRTDEGSRIRLAFVPGDREKDVLLTADYSQVELRVLAHFTQEPALLRAFEADEDIHRAVAAEVFGVPLDQVSKEQRGQAKIVNFGIIYGISASGLAQRIEGMSVAGAKQLIEAYNKRFPSIAGFMQKCVMEAKSQGYVETILGRRRPIPEINSGVIAQRNMGERMAINSVVQGSAADLIKMAMLHIHRRIRAEGWRSRLLLQVHDELVFETPKEVVEREAEAIRQEMVGAIKLRVPVKVDIGWGMNWQEGKK